MESAILERLEEELKASYDGAASTQDGNRRLVRLPVTLPSGCRPKTALALVVLDPRADKPEIYLSTVPTLPSGARPAMGEVVIVGETWNSFSYALRNWEAATHTGEQFVQGKLRRFGLAA